VLVVGSSLITKAQNLDTAYAKWELIGESLDGATSVYTTQFDMVYVVESAGNSIKTFSKDGKKLDSLGNQGFGDYQFDQPIDIDATNGLKIYVSDYNNRRIQLYDKRLQYLTSITPRDGSGFLSYAPTQLAVNNMLELFFYNEADNSIVKYNFQGELDMSFSARLEDIGLPPVDLDTFDDQLLIADQQNGVIHTLAGNGQYLKFWGVSGQIKALSVSASHIWVATKGFVHRFDKRGLREKRITIGRDIQPVDVAVGEKNIFLLTQKQLYKTTRNFK